MGKRWELKPSIDLEFQKKFPEINPAVLQLLYNRGIKSQKQIDEFLNPDYSHDIHDPFLFKDMNKAVGRIFTAIKNKEKIAINGDYDCDGVTGTVVLYNVLKEIGASDIEIYIPHRELEGYGLHLDTVEELNKKGITLIITVDCGISNKREIELANKYGIDVIITDHHHEPPELPKAYAIINPQIEKDAYPFKNLAGVGVAFKVSQALIRKNQMDIEEPGDDYWEAYEKWMLDLVAIGTVADSMDLVGENRTLVKYGLLVLNKTKRLGLLELIKIAGLEKNNVFKNGGEELPSDKEREKYGLKYGLSTYSIGFQIAPRINAAGRMDHANIAFKLLTSISQQEAKRVAYELQKKNQDRQQLTDRIITEIREKIQSQKDEKILFAIGNDWPVGIIGLVAGRIADEFYRPTIIITQVNSHLDGSGRSIPEFNVIEPLDKISNLFERYGGHAAACGFTLKDKDVLPEFMKKMKGFAEKELKGKDLTATLEIDARIKLDDVNWDLYEGIEKFEPFGQSNPRPFFLGKELEIFNIDKVGSEGKHLRLMVGDGGIMRKMIGFGIGKKFDKIKAGDKVDIVFEVSVNEWNGERELQLKIVDMKVV